MLIEPFHHQYDYLPTARMHAMPTRTKTTTLADDEARIRCLMDQRGSIRYTVYVMPDGTRHVSADVDAFGRHPRAIRAATIEAAAADLRGQLEVLEADRVREERAKVKK
jgi:hypothetical protein